MICANLLAKFVGTFFGDTVRLRRASAYCECRSQCRFSKSVRPSVHLSVPPSHSVLYQNECTYRQTLSASGRRRTL